MSGSTLFFGFIFGMVGLGYFMYGKKQGDLMALAVGIGLMVYPYFIYNLWLVLLVGVVLMALPFVSRHMGWS